MLEVLKDQVRNASPICFMQLAQTIREERAFDLAKAGRKMVAKSAMHATVIRSSVTVEARAVVALGDCTGMLMRSGRCLTYTTGGAYIEGRRFHVPAGA